MLTNSGELVALIARTDLKPSLQAEGMEEDSGSDVEEDTPATSTQQELLCQYVAGVVRKLEAGEGQPKDHLISLARCRITPTCLVLTGVREAVGKLGDNTDGSQGRWRDILLSDLDEVQSTGLHLQRLTLIQVPMTNHLGVSNQSYPTGTHEEGGPRLQVRVLRHPAPPHRPLQVCDLQALRHSPLCL